MVAWVQESTTGKTGAGTAITTSFGATPPVISDYIVVWAWGWNTNAAHNAGDITCVDNATGGSNTYTQVPGSYQAISIKDWCCMFYAPAVNTKANLIVTITVANESSGDVSAVAAEFNTVASSSPVDGSGIGTTGTSTSPAPGNLTVAVGDLVCCVLADGDPGNGTPILPAGFTAPDPANNPSGSGFGAFEGGGGAYKINPATPTNPAWTIGSSGWTTSQFGLLTDGPSKVGKPGNAVAGGWM